MMAGDYESLPHLRTLQLARLTLELVLAQSRDNLKKSKVRVSLVVCPGNTADDQVSSCLGPSPHRIASISSSLRLVIPQYDEHHPNRRNCPGGPSYSSDSFCWGHRGSLWDLGQRSAYFWADYMERNTPRGIRQKQSDGSGRRNCRVQNA